MASLRTICQFYSYRKKIYRRMATREIGRDAAWLWQVLQRLRCGLRRQYALGMGTLETEKYILLNKRASHDHSRLNSSLDHRCIPSAKRSHLGRAPGTNTQKCYILAYREPFAHFPSPASFRKSHHQPANHKSFCSVAAFVSSFYSSS